MSDYLHGGPPPAGFWPEELTREGVHQGRLLGSGSAGWVFAAEHPVYRSVAVKIWRRAHSDREARRFLDERAVHHQLETEPRIVRLYDARPGQRPWTITARYDESLADRLRPERADIPLAEAFLIADDVLAGLEAIHRTGHLHRDVKPANVLLREGRAALGDLGLVTSTERTTGVTAGTFPYIAYEVERGCQPTVRSDVFSAGVTLAELFGPQKPPALENLLTRATSVQPEDRPRDIADFRRRLRRLHDQLFPQDQQVLRTLEEPAVRVWQRRPVLIGVLAACLAVVAAGTVSAFVVGPDDGNGDISANNPPVSQRASASQSEEPVEMSYNVPAGFSRLVGDGGHVEQEFVAATNTLSFVAVIVGCDPNYSTPCPADGGNFGRLQIAIRDGARTIGKATIDTNNNRSSGGLLIGHPISVRRGRHYALRITNATGTWAGFYFEIAPKYRSLGTTITGAYHTGDEGPSAASLSALIDNRVA